MTEVRTKIPPPVARDRIITKFQSAYHADATPYQQVNFNPRVRDACSNSKTGTVGLKICKAVIVGDVAVGKSCLVNRFCHDVFDRDYKATIGVDFEVEKFNILSVPFNLQIWDTAGQERFKCIAASYYRGAHIVIVAFDLNEISSLANAKTWKEDACRNCDNPCVFLVGCKKDLLSDGVYADMEKEGIAVAKDIGAEFWALSSKTGENVKEFFFRVVSLTFDKSVVRELDTTRSEPKQQVGEIQKTFTLHNRNDRNLYEVNRKKHPKCC